MRNIIIKRIESLKSEEDNFKSKWWVNNFVSYTGIDEPKHISDIDFRLLDDNDLVRIFEYIILAKRDISSMRIRETYY